jgi:hypothetical protein
VFTFTGIRNSAADILQNQLNQSEQPSRPTISQPGWWLKLIPPLYRSGMEQFESAWDEYHRECRRLEGLRQTEQKNLAVLLQKVAKADQEGMSEMLARLIEEVDFPYETQAAFEFVGNDLLVLDVDLPEIEDLPAIEYRFNQRTLQIDEKPVSARAERLNYAAHIHAIGVLLASLAFAGLPQVTTVVFSGFSQREESSTGRIIDEYLLSIRIPRKEWLEIDFQKLGRLDPIAVVERFHVARQMTKTGIFKAVQTLSIHDS